MPAHRKTSAELEASGSFKHNPDRKREREGEPEVFEPLGDPPRSLDNPTYSCWVEIVDNAHPGTLSKGDRLFIEHGANLLRQLRDAKWIVAAPLLLRWEQFLSRLGMTPADRSRVRTNLRQEKAVDPFAAVFGDDGDDDDDHATH